MALKNNIVLKYLALLLFTFELLAPVFLFSSVRNFDSEVRQINVHPAAHQISLLSLLICEEAGSEEERENKEHKAICFSWESSPIQFCYQPEKFEVNANPSHYAEQKSSQPSLVVLHRNYRI